MVKKILGIRKPKGGGIKGTTKLPITTDDPYLPTTKDLKKIKQKMRELGIK